MKKPFTKKISKEEIKIIKITWYAWILWALLAWTWEFLLHYSPNILNTWEAYWFLAYVSMNNLFIGHFLAIIWMPLYFVWYFHLYTMLNRENNKLAKVYFTFGILAFIVWWIWLSSRGFLWTIVHFQNSMNPEIYKSIMYNYTYLLEIMVLILRLFIIIVSILWVYLIFKKKTYYPKWMSLFNPLLLLIITFSTLFIPSIGKYIVPIAMNFVHFIIFSLSLFCFYNFIQKWE